MAFSQTSSIERFLEKPWWRMSAGMAATSPAFIVTRARGRPVSRSDVTWNPSVTSVCGRSLFCPTTEEYILPIIHGNDRVEWFVQLSDEIHWEVEDRDSGKARARLVMKAGDVAAMPADIRHRGYSTKRSMLLVWENGSPSIPELIRTGKAPVVPVQF